MQRLLPSQVLVEASYVGNRATRLSITRQLNPTPARYLSTTAVRDNTVNSSMTASFPNPFYGLAPFYTANITRANLLRPYPQFGDISVQDPVGYSWYHSLQVRAARRMSRGFTIQAGYAFTKFLEAMAFLTPSDPLPYETVSASNRPHRVTMNGIWEIPIGRGRRFFSGMSAPWQAIAGNWQLSGVVVRQAGGPLDFGDILFNGDIQNIALPKDQRTVDRWFNTDAGFNKVSGQQYVYHIRTFPLRFSGIQADGQSKWDLSVSKAFRLGERARVQFRAHCFNIMNHANFAKPQMSPTNTAFGRITATQGLPRTFQFSLNTSF